MSRAAPRKELEGLGNTDHISDSASSVDVAALKKY